MPPDSVLRGWVSLHARLVYVLSLVLTGDAQTARARALAVFLKVYRTRPAWEDQEESVRQLVCELLASVPRLGEVEQGRVSLRGIRAGDPLRSDQLLRFLAPLSAEQRAMLVMRHLFFLSYPLIAQAMALPVAQVREGLAQATWALDRALDAPASPEEGKGEEL
jgi:DNA-directed RNA polymerase specialized sigma24 family protein